MKLTEIKFFAIETCIKMELELDLLIFYFYISPIKFYFLIFIIQIVVDVLGATLAERDELYMSS